MGSIVREDMRITKKKINQGEDSQSSSHQLEEATAYA